MKTVLAVLVLLIASTAIAQNKTVRDRNNNVVEIWRQQGDTTTVWTRDNEQLYTRYRQGDRVHLRAPDNSDLGEEYYNEDR